MNQYIAFLRGINISGKNKIAMSELKTEFENLNYLNVSTYLNSGNVMFETGKKKVADIRKDIEGMIIKRFGLEIPVYVIAQNELVEILDNSPDWWGTDDKDKYDNLIFILSDDTPEEICNMVGEPSEELEMIQVYKNVIFWTFDRKLYQKCNWWKKTAKAGIAEKLTIRTANTLYKLLRVK